MPDMQAYLRPVRHVIFVTMLLISLHATRTTCLNLEWKSSYDHRECRSRGLGKGDVGELYLIDPPKIDSVNHPRNLLKMHSRKKRFISFPPGSSLTVKNELRIKKNSHDRHDFTLLVGLPFTIDLPEGPLQIIKFSSGEEEEEEEEEEEPPKYNYIRIKRSAVDRQRRTAFDFVESTLNSFGLPGKSCLLKAICESAEDPLDSMGMLGEVLNMFLSASFGGNTEEMSEFIAAEEEGRRNASCSQMYQECPFHLVDFLHSGLSIVHSGLVSASTS